MTKDDVRNLMISWGTNETRVFAWPRPMVPTEYISFRRQQDYDTGTIHFFQDLEASTKSLSGKKTMSSPEMEGLILKEGLEFHSIMYYSTNVKTLKTGGCECGSFVFGPTYPHSRGCPLWRE